MRYQSWNYSGDNRRAAWFWAFGDMVEDLMFLRLYNYKFWFKELL